MTTSYATVYVTKMGIEFECGLEVQGDVIYSGSNAYGSDEPAEVDVQNVELTNARGKPVSKRFEKMLTNADWESITDSLISSASY